MAPHLTTLARDGTLEYLADNDDVSYLAISRAPYYGELGPRDPFLGRWEKAPVLYSWMQFVPLARLTRLLGLPLILTGLVWRVLGGCVLGIALFVLFRRLFSGTNYPVAWALGCSVICLTDAGFIHGRSFVQDFVLLRHLADGTTPMANPNALPQYRVVTPLLNLPILVLLVASLVPGGRGWAASLILGVASLGLTILLYFYFWTAAVVALGLYIVILLLDAWWNPERRRLALSRAGFTSTILAGGLALGAPQIYENARTFAEPRYEPILRRCAKPFPLAPDDPARWKCFKNYWVWAKLAIGALGVLALRCSGIGVLWCFTLAGYGLANSAVVTGLEFENFHWLTVCNFTGEVMVLGVLGRFLDRRPGARGLGLGAIWLLAGATSVIAAVWRPYEAIKAADSARNTQIQRELRPLRPGLAVLGVDHALAGPTATNVAILYSQCAQLYSHPYSWTFSLVPDEVLHERHALNGWLMGLDLLSYSQIATERNVQFPRPEWEGGVVRGARARIFEQLSERSDAQLLDRYRPDYLLLPATAPPPRRAGPWILMSKGPAWALWSRVASARQTSGDREGGSIHSQ
jgi:hypothetical protein